MVYRSLLVHLDDDERCGLRLELSFGLARRFESHLVGLSATGMPPLAAYAGLGALDAGTIELAETSLREQAQARADRFLERCRQAGLPSCEAVVDPDDAADSLVRHGHCSDLVIVSQVDDDAPGRFAAHDRLGRVVLQGARPTLMVPVAGRFDTVGERVLVAWDDSREAARALADALPVLSRATDVQVLQVGRASDGTAESARVRLEALRRWMAWHGVEARVAVELTEIEIGELLLSRASDMGADLIVMGAYGHSRWTERVFGGTTRTLLARMTVPVLMSH